MATAQVATTAATPFTVQCLGFYTIPDGCTATIELQVAELLSQIHERMTSAGGFRYGEPRLRNLAGNLDFEASRSASLGYAAYIERSSAPKCGLSMPATMIRVPGAWCSAWCPAARLMRLRSGTLIHEYFHATQFASRAVYLDWSGGRSENWVIEGTAAAATESYWLDNNLLRTNKFDIHDVDIPFDSEEEFDEYSAQDFWVFVGQQFSGTGTDLGYFDFILKYGADIQAVDDGLSQHFHTTLKDQLWDWASNQVFEKQNNLNGALGPACLLEGPVLQRGIEHHWELIQGAQLNHWPAGGGPAWVEPYTTLVVEITFPRDSDAEYVSFIYPECSSNTDGDALIACYKNAQARLPGQLYAENIAGCSDDDQGRLIDPDSGGKVFEGIKASRRYFAIVTNVTDSQQYFQMTSELSNGASLSYSTR